MTMKRVLLVVAIQLLAAHVLAADDVLEIVRRSGSRLPDGNLLHSNEERGTLSLGPDCARFDQGPDTSWIFRRGEGVLLLVRHDARTYERLPVPVRFEDYLNESEKRQLAETLPWQAPELSTQPTSEWRTIRSYRSRKFVIEGKPFLGKTTFRYDLWVTSDLPFDLALYRDLVRSSGALDLRLRGAAEQIADLPGFPVERESVVRRETGREDFDHRFLLSVAKRDLPASFYQPPAGYRSIPFQPGKWIELKPAVAESH
jgi:hypothetical protein